MTQVYLAARYSRREEMLGYAGQLEAFGYTVTARWITGIHEKPGAPNDGPSYTDAERAHFASEDLADLRAADILIAFTEPAHAGPARGGRHVELGYALASGHRVIVVGHRENVFCCLPEVEFHGSWESCCAMLARCAA